MSAVEHGVDCGASRAPRYNDCSQQTTIDAIELRRVEEYGEPWTPCVAIAELIIDVVMVWWGWERGSREATVGAAKIAITPPIKKLG